MTWWKKKEENKKENEPEKEEEKYEEDLKKYKINFENISKQCRWCIFSYLDKKPIGAFKLIPDGDKFCCFRFLDKKNLEAFNLIPSTDKFRCFDYLEYIENKKEDKFDQGKNQSSKEKENEISDFEFALNKISKEDKQFILKKEFLWVYLR